MTGWPGSCGRPIHHPACTTREHRPADHQLGGYLRVAAWRCSLLGRGCRPSPCASKIMPRHQASERCCESDAQSLAPDFQSADALRRMHPRSRLPGSRPIRGWLWFAGRALARCYRCCRSIRRFLTASIYAFGIDRLMSTDTGAARRRSHSRCQRHVQEEGCILCSTHVNRVSVATLHFPALRWRALLRPAAESFPPAPHRLRFGNIR
jgi:hypothetical protein